MQRVYRSDLRCPHCGSNGMPKAGFPTANRPIAAGNAIIATVRRATATTLRPK